LRSQATGSRLVLAVVLALPSCEGQRGAAQAVGGRSLAAGTGGSALASGGRSGSAGGGEEAVGHGGGSPSRGDSGAAPLGGLTAGTAGAVDRGGSTGTASAGAGTAGAPDAGGAGGGGHENGGATDDGGMAGDGSSDPVSLDTGPCDLYAAGATPCVAAYSTVRALSSAYTGSLYQVRRASGATQDIGVLAPGGFANAAEQDAFCGTDPCTISTLYDQSGHGNHLTRAPAGCYLAGGPGSEPSNESNASGRSLMVGGHRVYALYMAPHEGYRNNLTTGMPMGDDAQGIYELADGKRYGTGCCWDFGNASIDNCPSSTGQPNTLFFGTGYWGKGAGDGPWFMADFESGVWSGGSGVSTAVNSDDPSVGYDYALGILKTNATSYAIRVGNAQSGALVTAYDGALPFAPRVMMGGIVLGTSSDRSDSSLGTFFEGAITSGRPADAVDEAVLRNVRAAGYGS